MPPASCRARRGSRRCRRRRGAPRARTPSSSARHGRWPMAASRFASRWSTWSKQTPLVAMVYTVTPAQFRATAHKIADVIYEKMTGDPGVFSTRIAYITKQGSRFQLLVADADGFDPQTVVTSNEPMLSPRWSPDGTRIAYVSLESKKPVVYVQNLATGSAHGGGQFPRQQQFACVVAGRPHAGGDADQGRRFAAISDECGRQQSAARDDARRAIDTEAMFMPDGKSLLFTSDRGGSPQIYRLTLGSGARRAGHVRRQLQRFAAAVPDGKGFAFVRRDGGKFQIAVQDFATRQVQVLTAGPLDESPSVAPNGKLVLYANEVGGRGILAAVSSDGRVKQRLVAPATDVREPAWGPFPRPITRIQIHFRAARMKRAPASLGRRLHEKIPVRRCPGGGDCYNASRLFDATHGAGR